MKRDQIKIGGVYSAKVSGKLVGVKIIGVNQYGGWDATNLHTSRVVHIKTAQRLRAEFKAPTRRVTTVLAAGSMPTKADKAAHKKATTVAPRNAQGIRRTPARVMEVVVKAADTAKSGPDAMPNIVGGVAAFLEAKDKRAATKTAKGADAKVKAVKPKPARKPSGLDVAAKVLSDAGKPLGAKAIVETMLAKGLWKTNGKTPAATIYAAMLREVDNKPGESRFEKVGRGLFTLAQAKK